MKKLLLVITILAAATLGCKMLGGSGTSSGGGGTATGGSDPKADVIAASKKFVDLKSFSAKMEGMGQTEIKQQVDYVAPDRYHVMYQGGNAVGMELIYIGNDSYMKSGPKWTKMPGGNATAIPNLRDSFTEQGLKTLTDVKFEGEDTANGKSCLVYTYKNQTPVGAYPFSCKMWVDKASGIPVKNVIDYTNGMLKQMTVNYDTETPVTIEAPAT